MNVKQRDETLREVLAIASASLDTKTIVQRVIELAVERLDADWGEIHLLATDGSHRTYFGGLTVDECNIASEPCLEGVNGAALIDREVVRTLDVSAHPRSVGFPEDHVRIGPFLGVPVFVDGTPLADILLAREKGTQPFTKADEKLLVAIAEQVALALRNARLFEQSQQRLGELETLHELTIGLSRVLDLDEIIERIHHAIAQVMKTDDLYVALHDEETNTVHFPLYFINGVEQEPLSRPFGNGLTEYVIRAGEPLLLNSDIPGKLGALGIDLIGQISFSLLAVPMRVGQKTIGVITAQDYERPDVYTEHHQMLLAAIANQSAVALENARLYQETRQHGEELQALFQVSSALRTATGRDELLRVVLDQTLQVIGVEDGGLFFPDSTGEIMHVQEARGVIRELAGLDIPTAASIVGRVFRQGTLFATDDLGNDPETYALSAARVANKAKAGIAAPLRSGERITGVLLSATQTTRQFDASDERLVATIAEMAGSALERQQFHEEVVAAYEELRKTQAQLVQSEKLSAIGQLVAGVAHEINNPLTGIIGFSELLSRDRALHDPELAASYTSKIREQAERVRRIVEDLLSFARQREPRREPASVNGLLRRVLQMRRYALRTSNIAVQTELAAELPITVVDPHQLQQVFLNLVNNAEQALSNTYAGGNLTIRSRQIDEQTIRVEFEDDGPGITEEHLGKVFDPFFTTKEVGQGTGLGLSICYGIVQEHGGHIWAESPAGEADSGRGPGTRFTVELPLRKSTWAAEMMAKEMDRDVPKNSPLRILVVDDEEIVASFLSDALGVDGHRIDHADQAEKALALLRDRSDYDLILCDLRMPGIGGRGFYEQVDADNPLLASRVVFITGDTASPLTRQFLANTGQPCLEKPFSVDEVRQLIAKAERRLRGTRPSPPQG